MLYPALAACGLTGSAWAEEPEIQVAGQVQTWVTVYDQDEDPQADPAGYGDPEADPGFSIRRVRFGPLLSWGALDASLIFGTGATYDVLGTSDLGIGLVDAVAGYTVEGSAGKLRLSLGTQRVPLSREQLISSATLSFQERSVSSTWLSPQRETGFLADYTLPFGLRARAGVFNGGGSFLGDDNGGVLSALRLEYGRGDTYRTWGQGTAYGVALSGSYNLDVATEVLGGTADALVRFGPVTLMVEASLSQISPRGDLQVTRPAVLDPTVRLGGLAHLGVTVPLTQGDLEIASRFSLFDDATKRDDNGDVGILHAGVTWREPVPLLDLGVGYIHRAELAGRTLPNDTVRLWAQVAFPGRSSADPTAEAHTEDQ